MKDTSDKIDKKFRDMLLDRSGEERLKMGCSMHTSARALVIASIPEKDRAAVKRELFLRFYGIEFDSKRRKRILRALSKASNNSGSNSVHEDKGTYRKKVQSKAHYRRKNHR